MPKCGVPKGCRAKTVCTDKLCAPTGTIPSVEASSAALTGPVAVPSMTTSALDVGEFTAVAGIVQIPSATPQNSAALSTGLPVQPFGNIAIGSLTLTGPVPAGATLAVTYAGSGFPAAGDTLVQLSLDVFDLAAEGGTAPRAPEIFSSTPTGFSAIFPEAFLSPSLRLSYHVEHIEEE